MTFTFSRKTGHIKRDGAVIGRVEECPDGFEAFLFVDRSSLSDRTLIDLLAKVRKRFEHDHEKPLTKPKPAAKVRRR